METEKLPTPIKFEKWCAWNAAPCEKSSEAQIERLQEKIKELEAMLSAVGAGGVSAQRVTQGQKLGAAPHLATKSEERKPLTNAPTE